MLKIDELGFQVGCSPEQGPIEKLRLVKILMRHALRGDRRVGGDIQSDRPAGFVSDGHRGKAVGYLCLDGSAQCDSVDYIRSELARADLHRIESLLTGILV